jgi:hypothetical protein
MSSRLSSQAIAVLPLVGVKNLRLVGVLTATSFQHLLTDLFVATRLVATKTQSISSIAYLNYLLPMCLDQKKRVLYRIILRCTFSTETTRRRLLHQQLHQQEPQLMPLFIANSPPGALGRLALGAAGKGTKNEAEVLFAHTPMVAMAVQ